MTKEIDIQQLATWPESQTFDRKASALHHGIISLKSLL